MSNTAKISSRQLMILTAVVTVGDSILVLPSVVANNALKDAWISALIGLVAGLGIILLFVAAGKINPQLNLIELNRTVFGNWAGMIVSLIFLAYSLLSISAFLREIGDFNASQIMPDTPIESIHILLLIIIIFAAQLGLETIARTAEVFFPWFILFFVFLVVSLLPDIDPNKILPVFDQGIKPSLRGSIASAAFPFAELVAFMMIFPYVSKPKEIRKGMLIGATIGGIVLVITIALSILVVGAAPSSRNMYPSYDVVKRISIGEFFQRVEATMALMWIVTTFFKMSVFFYAFNQGVANLLKLKDYRLLLLPWGMIIAVLSLMIAPNITYYSNFSDKYWPFMDMSFSVLLPLLLIVGYAIRKKLR